MAPLPQRQNAKENIKQNTQTSVKRRPADGSSLPVQTTVAANDNTKPTQTENTKNIPAGVPSTRRGGAPVVQNPTAVDEETLATLPRQISDSLQNQTQVKKDDKYVGVDGKDYDGDEDEEEALSNYDFLTRNLQRQNNLEDLEILQEIEDETQAVSGVVRRSADFPFIMFIITVVEWIFSIVFALLSLVLSATGVLIPVGIAIDVLLYVWKFIFSSLVFVWTFSYEKKQTGHLRLSAQKADTTMSIIRQAKNFKKFGAKGTYLLVGLAPVIDMIIPSNPIMVWSVYRKVNKQIKGGK